MAEKSMQKSKIKVVDNFLPIFEFAPMKSEIEGANFPWYWQENSHANYFDGEWKADSVPQLCHGFIEDRKDISDWYNIFRFSTIFKKLDVEIIDKFKVNCNYKTSENNIGWFHTDFTDDRKDTMTTSIFYLNSNNGGTKFEDGTFVNSVSNRMVTFDCSLKHAPVSCKDSDRRVVASINYLKLKK